MNKNKLTNFEKEILKDTIIKREYDRTHPKWKKIYLNNIETEFEISNNGDVWSNKTNKLLKPHLSTTGYPAINFNIGGKTKFKEIHRLVAEAVIPNPENKPQVNHINANKLDPWVGNLEWVTAKENVKHAIDNGLRDGFLGINSPKNIYSENTIHNICRMLENGETQKSIANKLKVNKGTVNSIKQKKIWTHISSNYNIPDTKHRVPRPNDLRINIENDLKSGINNISDILNKYNLNNDRINRTYVMVIRRELCDKDKSSTTIENADNKDQ